MRYCNILRPGWAAAVAVLLTEPGTVAARPGTPPLPPWAGRQGGSGGTAPTFRQRQPQNLGVWSTNNSTGSQRSAASVGGSTTGGGGSVGFGGFGSFFAGLLSPDQEMAVLQDTF